MPGIAADSLLKHLEVSGHVIMQKPPTPRHKAPD
jgi:hypothetical protein